MNDSYKQKELSPLSAGASQSGGAPTMRRMTSDELLAGRKELAIEHSGEEYRLRITSKGKLILTK
ncbi:hypothetical protein MNBD_GAMMA18-71 [hydrothermal vent metagenome]|uniref:Hemin uptake protein HemP n=1 Tax=hydrothermal vent metagenome TaxID=652676 RepID=A0A3B1A3C1_9ZZZZ